MITRRHRAVPSTDAMDEHAIAPGQRWEAIGAADDWLLVLEPGSTEGAWLMRSPVGLEREIDAEAILNSYRLA